MATLRTKGVDTTTGQEILGTDSDTLNIGSITAAAALNAGTTLAAGTTLNVGSTTSASTIGDFAAGQTGAGNAIMFWDESAKQLSIAPNTDADDVSLRLGTNTGGGSMTVTSNGTTEVEFTSRDGASSSVVTSLRFTLGQGLGGAQGGNFIFSAGFGGQNVGASGGDLTFNGGTSTQFAAIDRYGAFFFVGGGRNTRGGNINMRGGGGTGAEGLQNVQGGDITIDGGDVGSGSVRGGNVTIRGGDNTGTFTAGSITIRGGANSNAGGTHGSVIIDAGTGTATTLGTITIGTANTGAVTIGRTAATLDFDASFIQVNSLPLPTVLASVASVDLTTVADTSLFTVPAGRTAKVISVVVTPDGTPSAPGADSIVSVGTNSAPFDNIIADTPLTGLDATTESFTLEVGGISHIGAAAEVITFRVDTADTGTTLTATVELIGYLV